MKFLTFQEPLFLRDVIITVDLQYKFGVQIFPVINTLKIVRVRQLERVFSWIADIVRDAVLGLTLHHIACMQRHSLGRNFLQGGLANIPLKYKPNEFPYKVRKFW